MVISAQALVKAMGVSETSWGKTEYMRREGSKLENSNTRRVGRGGGTPRGGGGLSESSEEQEEVMS